MCSKLRVDQMSVDATSLQTSTLDIHPCLPIPRQPHHSATVLTCVTDDSYFVFWIIEMQGAFGSGNAAGSSNDQGQKPQPDL